MEVGLGKKKREWTSHLREVFYRFALPDRFHLPALSIERYSAATRLSSKPEARSTGALLRMTLVDHSFISMAAWSLRAGSRHGWKVDFTLRGLPSGQDDRGIVIDAGGLS